MEIVEEIAQHLEERYFGLLRFGASDSEAAAGALRELDESDALGRAIARVEAVRRLDLPPPGVPSRASWLNTAWQDVRYSGRTLAKSPGFSTAVVLALALSIGPLTAIVSIGNWLLWRPHPGVTDSGSLATVWFGQWRDTGKTVSFSPANVSYANLADMRARALTFTGIAGVQESSSSISVPGGPPRHAPTAIVTADFFDVLGVHLVAGRSFTADEDRPPLGTAVAVISEGLATGAFASPANAIGKSIQLNSRPFTVIGVASAAFRGISPLDSVEVWLTGATWPYLNHVKNVRLESRGRGIFYGFIVRAAPGRTFDEVERELKVLAVRLADSHPADNAEFRKAVARVFPGLGVQPLERRGIRRMVNTMLAVGAILLLLGCANVANLLVFRAARREHEVAVRKAMGASIPRLMQLQVMESWVLATGGAVLGLVLAVYLKQLMQQLLFPRAPGVVLTVPLDLRVLAATLTVAVGTGTLAALAPAWLAARTNTLAALGRGTRASSRAPRLRGGLAVVQLGLSLTLLTAALLLVATLRNLLSVDLGLDPAGITVLGVELDEHGYDETRAMAYHREVLPALESNGDFETVSLSGLVPFGSTFGVRLIPPGGDPKTPLRVAANGITENYFRILSIPLIRGRAFTRQEVFASSDLNMPAILNETLAHQLFGTVDVLGRTVRLAATQLNREQEMIVVGVARDSRWRSLMSAPDPFLYQPFGQFTRQSKRGMYMIRSKLPPTRVVELATAIAARIASSVPFAFPRPLSTGLDRQLSEQRLFAWMLSLLAALGFVLASLGLYGLVSQAMLERQREFGIRLAVGAAAADIVRLVARYALTIGGAGVVFGLSFSYFGTRIVQQMLFGVSPLEPGIYLVAILTLVLVVLLACIGPAVRAVRVQPVDVLRAE
jgi:predicted permease